MGKKKKDVFRTERNCFNLLGKRYTKILNEVGRREDVKPSDERSYYAIADGYSNYRGSVKPPFTKREREAQQSPLGAY